MRRALPLTPYRRCSLRLGEAVELLEHVYIGLRPAKQDAEARLLEERRVQAPRAPGLALQPTRLGGRRLAGGRGAVRACGGAEGPGHGVGDPVEQQR